MKKKNIVIIGSGPSSLIKSIILSNMGHPVTVLESSNKVGGAWHTNDTLGFKSIECGPHFFHTEPQNNLFSLMGVETINTPPPIWNIKIANKSIKANEKSGKLFAYFFGLLVSSVRLTKKLILPSKRNLKVYFVFNEFLPLLKAKTSKSYFINGSNSFINKLIKLATESGVSIVKERLESVSVNKEQNSLSLQTDKTIYKADNLYLTDRSVFSTFTVNGVSNKLTVDKIYRVQVHFIIESNKKINFFVHKFVHDDYFAVTNLSLIYDKEHLDLPDNQNLLTVTITKYTQDEEINESKVLDTINYFKKINILPHDSKLISYQSSVYADFRFSAVDIKNIKNQSNGLIKFIGHIDLVHALDGFYKDFKKHI